MPSAIELDVARLILEERWGAIATLNEREPLASMVAYAAEPKLDGVLFFLSQLAQHTRNLLADPRASLAITRPDTGENDPQLLPRVTLTGSIQVIDRDSEEWDAASVVYLARFPDAAPRFDLGDFALFRLRPAMVRYVGGFARALSMTPDELADAAAALAGEATGA